MTKLPLVDAIDLADVFQNVETILQLSRLLLAELNEAVENWKPNSSSIAAPFLELGPFFACYETYAAGFERAQKLMDVLNVDPSFAPFLKSAKSNGLTLDALLVMPVQRMPRYKLLLADLVKHTPESHPDHKGLTEAVVGQFFSCLFCSSHAFLSREWCQSMRPTLTRRFEARKRRRRCWRRGATRSGWQLL
jgi:hypothetical protein